MVDPKKKRYLYLMLSISGAISLSILFFFLLFRMQGVGAALKDLSQILAPFIYGSVVAYLLRPLCNHYEAFFRKLLPRKHTNMANAIAVGLSLVTGLLIVYALIIMIAPELYVSIKSLWNSIPQKAEQVFTWARERFGEEEELLHYLNSIYESVYAELGKWAQETLMPSIASITNIVSSVGSSVIRVLSVFYNMLIGLIVACYLLAIRKRLGRQGVLVIRSMLKPRWADLVLEEVAFVDRMFGGFIDGKIVDSAIIGVLCYIGCMVFKFPNALLISAFVGITNVIPFFGPFIGAIPSTFLILIDDPIKALWFVLFILALQQLDGNVIGPAILGDRTGLSSFWVLFTILLFGGLWGVVGMVVGVPLFAVIYDTVKKLVRKGLHKQGQSHLWDQYKADYPDEK